MISDIVKQLHEDDKVAYNLASPKVVEVQHMYSRDLENEENILD